MLLEIGEGRHEVDEDLGPDFMKVPGEFLIPNPEYDPALDRYEDVNGVPTSLGLKRILDAMYNQADLNNPATATDEYFCQPDDSDTDKRRCLSSERSCRGPSTRGVSHVPVSGFDRG